ncbi:MAG: hypothetical protein M1818_006470 [Claussenomyces sp. TS43310]|nr:MAG: hypothetical protein M1818_006470 [Claussenomyces sp. TS43310]
MASSSGRVPPGGLVLVTGVTGFIGSYIASGLLGLGYRVRGTVRSSDKAAWVTEAMTERHPSADFEAVVLPDQNAAGAWDAIVKGVDGIAHVAGDTTFGPDPNKVITPSVAGLRSFLEAANTTESSVKRFVLTSSNQAALNRTFGKEMLVNGSMWNEEAIESAWRPPPYEEERGWDVYSALKAQTEREMWRFSREDNPKFVVNSVLPSCTIGAIFHENQAGSTAKWVLDTFKDPANHAFLKEFGASHFCYVEDVALLHIGALTQEDVKNERLFGFGGAINFNSWLDVFRKLDPSKPWPENDPAQPHDLSKIDGKTELNLLKYFGKAGWTDFEDSVRQVCLESR